MAACASLRVPLARESAENLVALVVNMCRRRLSVNSITYTTWSLALLGVLGNGTFKLMLKWLSGCHVARVPTQHMRPMYVALDWLQPSSNVEDQQDWLQLQAQLESLGPRPHDHVQEAVCKNLYAALMQQQLKFTHPTP